MGYIVLLILFLALLSICILGNTKKIIAWMLMCLSVLWILANTFRWMIIADWLKTTATVTEVIIRYDIDGKVTDSVLFGTYTDIDGTLQENVRLYEVSSFSMFIKESYVGEKVRILYDRNGVLYGSNMDTIISFDNYMLSWIFSIIVMNVSLIFLWLYLREAKEEKLTGREKVQERVENLDEWIDFLQKNDLK